MNTLKREVNLHQCHMGNSATKKGLRLGLYYIRKQGKHKHQNKCSDEKMQQSVSIDKTNISTRLSKNKRYFKRKPFPFDFARLLQREDIKEFSFKIFCLCLIHVMLYVSDVLLHASTCISSGFKQVENR